MTARPDDVEIAEGVKVKGSIRGRARQVRPLPREGQVLRYILTSAQNNTPVHEGAWLSLLALASHYGAELIVGTYSYNKSAYGRKAVKRGTSSASDFDDLWYDPQVVEHILDEPVQLAPGLVWAGELNVIPTSMQPLSQMEAYNRRDSNIVPHAKFAMTSVAAMRGEATKFNFTTGTCTQRNYIQKKIGLLSEQFHGYGGLLVEVCDDGSWYVRQLQATEEGTIRDLRLKAEAGVVTDGNPVRCITWGDIHQWYIDPEVNRLGWGPGGMLDELRPEYQVLHDVVDQRARNHHESKDPVALYRKWRDGRESVSAEIVDSAEWMATEASRDWCTTFVAPSNHHEAIERWLREADVRQDPVNKRFFHEAWLALLDDEDDVYRWACLRARPDLDARRVRFLSTDQPLVLDGIDVGQHGHLGPNGARGNGKAFAKLGRPTTTAHEHTASIHLNSWVAGCSCLLRLSYNRGPSSWSHSHVVQYPEGTRTVVTMWKGRWRA